jgi:hypothetical protein
MLPGQGRMSASRATSRPGVVGSAAVPFRRGARSTATTSAGPLWPRRKPRMAGYGEVLVASTGLSFVGLLDSRASPAWLAPLREGRSRTVTLSVGSPQTTCRKPARARRRRAVETSRATDARPRLRRRRRRDRLRAHRGRAREPSFAEQVALPDFTPEEFHYAFTNTLTRTTRGLRCSSSRAAQTTSCPHR